MRFGSLSFFKPVVLWRWSPKKHVYLFIYFWWRHILSKCWVGFCIRVLLSFGEYISLLLYHWCTGHVLGSTFPFFFTTDVPVLYWRVHFPSSLSLMYRYCTGEYISLLLYHQCTGHVLGSTLPFFTTKVPVTYWGVHFPSSLPLMYRSDNGDLFFSSSS